MLQMLRSGAPRTPSGYLQGVCSKLNEDGAKVRFKHNIKGFLASSEVSKGVCKYL